MQERSWRTNHTAVSTHVYHRPYRPIIICEHRGRFGNKHARSFYQHTISSYGNKDRCRFWKEARTIYLRLWASFCKVDHQSSRKRRRTGEAVCAEIRAPSAVIRPDLHMDPTSDLQYEILDLPHALTDESDQNRTKPNRTKLNQIEPN